MVKDAKSKVTGTTGEHGVSLSATHKTSSSTTQAETTCQATPKPKTRKGKLLSLSLLRCVRRLQRKQQYSAGRQNPFPRAHVQHLSSPHGSPLTHQARVTETRCEIRTPHTERSASSVPVPHVRQICSSLHRNSSGVAALSLSSRPSLCAAPGPAPCDRQIRRPPGTRRP